MGDSGDAVTMAGWRGASGAPPGWEDGVDDPHDAPAAPRPPQVPGHELGTLLARGGTSEVWAAVACDGGRRVVVKVVHAELDAVEVASREAAVSARAASAHVVPVEGCVPLPDGRVAVVMPHLLGGALDALVRARGHLSPGEVVTVLAPVASALGRLHDLGVVHGDVSPGNVLLDLDGRPLLADLGLGHVVGEVSPGVWGTDGYVAPEVLLGADPTPAGDVYGLGALGWLCLTGTVPGPPGLRPELSEVCLAGEGSEPVVSALALAIGAEPRDRPSAHELAWLLFAAAEPEPLRLVHGDDEVSAVTYRLRAAAGRAPADAQARHRRWWPFARGRGEVRGLAPVVAPSLRGLLGRSVPRRPGRSGRHRGGVVLRGWGPLARGVRRTGTGTTGFSTAGSGTTGFSTAGSGTDGFSTAGWGAVPRRVPSAPGRWWRPLPLPLPLVARAAVVSTLLCLGLLSLVVLGAAVLGRADESAQGRSLLGAGGPADAGRTGSGAPRPSTPASSTAGPVPRSGPAAAPAATDPRTDPRAPTTRAGELLTVLAGARAAAWLEATPALLHAADARGSAMAARDAADVAEVERAGLRYTGLHYTVADVSVVSATTRRAVLRARVDAGPYTVTGATGSTPRPAVPGIPVLVDLVHTDVGWRMADLRPVP